MKIRFASQARTDADSIGGLKVPYAPAKRHAPRWRWYLILLAVATPVLLLAMGMLSGLLTRSAQGTVMLDQIEVRSLASGRLENLWVATGAEVLEGAALAATLDASGAVDGLRATLQVDEHARRTVPPRDAGAELALKARALQLARERRDSLARLLNAGAATQAEVREAEYGLDQASAEWLRARRELEAQRAAASPANRGALRIVQSRSGTSVGGAPTINRAPAAGKVLDVFVTPGEIVRAGDPLLLLGRQADPKIVAYVPPGFATRLSVGSPATILFADGSRSVARVSEAARVTRRMPADLVDNYGLRPMMVVLQLTSASPWPPSQTIHGMPVRIRFHYGWEANVVGRLAVPLLDALTGKP